VVKKANVYILAWRQPPSKNHIHGKAVSNSLKDVRNLCKEMNDKYPYIETWYEKSNSKCVGDPEGEEKNRPDDRLIKFS
jgi:hypothetical protein